MGYSVSSSFLSQIEGRNWSPVRYFKIGTSDYTSRITKFPTVKRISNEIKSVDINVPLANADGALNHFYEQTYTIPATCTIEIGIEGEVIKIYTGHLKNVQYSNEKCTLKIKDKIWDFTNRKVGASDAHVDIGSTIPSDIAWTLSTCYGGMSNIASTSNPDIDYSSFLVWAEQFSSDNLLMSANYKGMKVVEALGRLGIMTDSSIWVEGNGKLNFARFTEPSSLDITITADENLDVVIDVETLRLVNKHYTSFNYSVGSNYWQSTVYTQDSTSVDSFGLHEEALMDESIWHVDSVSALGLSQRKVNLLRSPPKRFEIITGLYGIQRQISETVRLVDSFYGVTSASGWRLVGNYYDTDRGIITRYLDEATVMNGFYLDASDLDGNDLLL